MTQRVAIHTLGCRANQYDSESLGEQLIHKGYQIVSFTEIADIYLVNTCTVTRRADNEARRLIRKARRLSPAAKIIATGCYAQVAPEELSKESGVDYVVGNDRKGELLALITRFSNEGTRLPEPVFEKTPLDLGRPPNRGLASRRSQLLHPPIGGERLRDAFLKQDPEKQVPSLENPLHQGTSLRRSRAYVKIQDGCNFRCSFCIIPFARGASRSRLITDIVEEIRQLKECGYHEVVLTGIHIGSYGWDLKPRQTLLDLMKALEKNKPIDRIRLSTLDPDEVSEEMIDLLGESDLFCPHLHMAIQSGEDIILKKMRRRHTTKQLQQMANRAFRRVRDLGFGADIITGFPGETEKHHATTHRLLEDLPLTYLHVFPYSEREGTSAATMEGKVPVAIRKERAAELIELGDQKKKAFWKSQVRKKKRVILEDRMEGPCQKGITDNFIPLWIPDLQERKGLLKNILLDRLENGKVMGHVIHS